MNHQLYSNLNSASSPTLFKFALFTSSPSEYSCDYRNQLTLDTNLVFVCPYLQSSGLLLQSPPEIYPYKKSYSLITSQRLLEYWCVCVFVCVCVCVCVRERLIIAVVIAIYSPLCTNVTIKTSLLLSSNYLSLCYLTVYYSTVL